MQIYKIKVIYNGIKKQLIFYFRISKRKQLRIIPNVKIIIIDKRHIIMVYN